MKLNRNILVLILLTMVGTVFGQETDWEKEDLQGKVKRYELFSYEFDISDSINHDEFMNRFYHCDFDVDRMIRFADSIILMCFGMNITNKTVKPKNYSNIAK